MGFYRRSDKTDGSLHLTLLLCWGFFFCNDLFKFIYNLNYFKAIHVKVVYVTIMYLKSILKVHF